MLAYTALLSLAALTMARPQDYTGNAPDNLSPCGASVFLAAYSGWTECIVKTSTNRDGSGEVLLLDDICVTAGVSGYPIPHGVGKNDPKDSGIITETADVDWDSASIIPFKMYPDPNFPCSADGCFPILEYVHLD